MSLNIEIDCAPGATRPQTYFDNIAKLLIQNENKTISEFGKRIDTMKPISTKFGSWDWVITLSGEELTLREQIQSCFKNELTKLYNLGAIRFASW